MTNYEAFLWLVGIAAVSLGIYGVVHSLRRVLGEIWERFRR